MDRQQIAKQAFAEVWAWATEDGAERSNARSCMEDGARAYGIDPDDVNSAPEDTDWAAFCENLVTRLGKDDDLTRECAREWSDGGWYDASSGRAASMLWRALRSGD